MGLGSRSSSGLSRLAFITALAFCMAFVQTGNITIFPSNQWCYSHKCVDLLGKVNRVFNKLVILIGWMIWVLNFEHLKCRSVSFWAHPHEGSELLHLWNLLIVHTCHFRHVDPLGFARPLSSSMNVRPSKPNSRNFILMNICLTC